MHRDIKPENILVSQLSTVTNHYPRSPPSNLRSSKLPLSNSLGRSAHSLSSSVFPESFYVPRSNKNGQPVCVKLADFGWACLRGEDRRTTLCGTVEYMSAELVRGFAYDCKESIFIDLY